jgi:hypothetical protein
MSCAVPPDRLADHLASADRYAGSKLEPVLAIWSTGTTIATIQRRPASGDLWLTVSHDAGGSAGPVGDDAAIIARGIALLGGALPPGCSVAVSGVDADSVDVATGSGAWIAAVRVGDVSTVTTTIRDGDGRIDSSRRWSLPSVPIATHRDVTTT